MEKNIETWSREELIEYINNMKKEKKIESDYEVGYITENKNNNLKQYKITIPSKFAKDLKLTAESNYGALFIQTNEGTPQKPKFRLLVEFMDKEEAKKIVKQNKR